MNLPSFFSLLVAGFIVIVSLLIKWRTAHNSYEIRRRWPARHTDSHNVKFYSNLFYFICTECQPVSLCIVESRGLTRANSKPASDREREWVFGVGETRNRIGPNWCITAAASLQFLPYFAVYLFWQSSRVVNFMQISREVKSLCIICRHRI